MSTGTDAGSAEERSAAAGEYVLGTLDAAERRVFEAALSGDAALRAEVAAWQDRLLGLARHAAPADPGPALWSRIERSLMAAVAAAATPLAAPLAASASASSPASAPQIASRPAVPRHAPEPWWRRLVVWQGLAFASTLLAAALAVVALRPPPGDAARYVAVLQSPADASTGWIVEAYGAGGAAVLRLMPVSGVGGPVPAGRSLQFWTKPEGAAAPTSLGLVRAGTALSVPVAQLPGLGERQLFEITLEPEGGSTVGRPTGPILYVGRTVRL